MSVPTSGGYSAGGYPAGGPPGAYAPPVNRVDFGWITQAWQFFMAQAGVWVVATLALIGPAVVVGIAFYIYMLAAMFPGGFPPHAPAPGAALPAPAPPVIFAPGNAGKIVTVEFAVIFVFSLYSAFLYGGMFRMAVRQVRGLALTFRDIFRGGPLFGRMLGAMFLLYFASYALEAIGLGPGYFLLLRHAPTAATVVAFLVGGLVWLGSALVLPALLLPACALMADGVRLFPALRRSVQAMKSHWLPAAGFVFVLGLLFYASYFACLIGMLVTTPMIFLVTALTYRDLAGMPDVLPPSAPYYAPAAPGVWPPPPTA